ncbi:MAG: smalltalk protein [Prevotellaceae bacterium]|nr:smalltalk protein [Prevotellaceae bacterium]
MSIKLSSASGGTKTRIKLKAIINAVIQAAIAALTALGISSYGNLLG